MDLLTPSEFGKIYLQGDQRVWLAHNSHVQSHSNRGQETITHQEKTFGVVLR